MRSLNIAIALPLEDDMLDPLRAWGQSYDFTNIKSVTFIHVVKKNITPLEFGLLETPDDSTFNEMVPTIDRFLKEEARKILPKDFKGTVNFEITKDFHPEAEVVEILEELKADLIVVATRGKHGFESLFHSSFTDHMIKFAPCDVFVVRPHEELRKSA